MNTSINTSNIAATARIAASAQISPDVIIEDYVVVEGNVRIASGCHLKAHCVIRENTQLGEYVFVDCFSCIGGDPQIRGFNREIVSGVKVGAHTTIREGVTIHRSSHPNQHTSIGDHCMLMAQCHVAHDCDIQNHVTLVNQVLLGGHVQVHNHAIIGGGTAVHQFTRIGDYAMIGGNSTVTYDIAPTALVSDRNQIHGINRVGLKRAGFSRETRNEIKILYKEIVRSAGNPASQAQALLLKQTATSPLGKLFLSFFTHPSRRGFARALPLSTKG
jgi:UDP-N-acetylglucosamine acyltransferase